MIKFNLYNITTENTKTKVSYSLDNHISGKPCVTIYASDYIGTLSMFENYVNDSDVMTDYFAKEGQNEKLKKNKEKERPDGQQEGRVNPRLFF